MAGAGGPDGTTGSVGFMTRAGETMVRRLSEGLIDVSPEHSDVFMSLLWLDGESGCGSEAEEDIKIVSLLVVAKSRLLSLQLRAPPASIAAHSAVRCFCRVRTFTPA
jgi:hypothetical protein